MQMILVLIIFVSVSLITYSAITYYLEYKRRIKYEESILTEYDLVRRKSFLGQLRPLLQLIVKLNEKSKFTLRWIEKSHAKYNNLIVKAGEPGNVTGKEFLALKQLSPVIIAAFMAFIFAIPFSIVYIIFIIFGFILPDLWLNDKIRARQVAINRALPDALDTFALVVGAGPSFAEAMDIYITKSEKNALSEELIIVRNENRLGRTVSESLQAMAEKVDCTALTNFVTIIVQSQKTGASLSSVLDAQADDMRNKRFFLAEEAGQKAAIKIIFPLLMFIMPNIFIIIFSPLVLKFLYSKP